VDIQKILEEIADNSNCEMLLKPAFSEDWVSQSPYPKNSKKVLIRVNAIYYDYLII
jgi:hypothetical protein